jgi:2-haloacid dehalogenase
MKDNNSYKERPKLILLDVYETLLDMGEVQKKINAIYNNRHAYTIWMGQFMQYCFVDNCIEQFNDFPAIAAATMRMTGQILSKEVTTVDINRILELLKHLPLNQGVQEGLSLLNDEGFLMAALTNSPQKTVVDRMERTGLISYFSKVMSAEHVGKYKPYMGVYTWALEQMKVRPEETLLVSAHGWDIAGAVNAGMQTAYLLQSEQILYPLAPEPDYTCSNLLELANIFTTSTKTWMD